MIAQDSADALLRKIVQFDGVGIELRQQAMRALADLPNYDWVGVYLLDGQELVLDTYVGEPTEHTRIPVGVGVCGTAAAEGRNQVIQDVRTLSNYLVCSNQTRSEIVVLIRTNDCVLGQIDVDSHEVGAFDTTDEAMLEQVAASLAERWK